MSFDNYKFVLKTCASSENEVTGSFIAVQVLIYLAKK